VLTKGTATATPPMAPAPQVMATQVRRLGSTGPPVDAAAVDLPTVLSTLASLMVFLWLLR
jgi:hypothetical protein